jgi:hypothetical protein
LSQQLVSEIGFRLSEFGQQAVGALDIFMDMISTGVCM